MRPEPQKEDYFDFETMCGSDLMECISWKDEHPEEAEQAFAVFCFRYEKQILRLAEISCIKYGYNEAVASIVAHCTFARVWKYPKFDKNKARSKDIDQAIILWMGKILYTQIILYKKTNTCAEPSMDEDLSIIHNTDELVHFIAGDNPESKKELKSKLEILDNAFAGLSEKHKIIYLTYKAYENHGKYIPRSVSNKLKEQLELTPPSIRVYKKQAIEHIKYYLAKKNGS